MDTVKVDTQRLQLLNDRIAQTIEALNQLRMSVHGIQHTAAFAPWGYGFSPAVQPSYSTPYGVYPTPFVTPYAQPTWVPGIQHTPASVFASPFTAPYAAFASPYTAFTAPLTSPYASWTPGIQHTPSMSSQPMAIPGAWAAPSPSNGISHSSLEPSWQMRMPYVMPIASMW